jgi:hypothetical protein
MAGNIDWLRGRGIGRERLAGHLGEFLTANGFELQRSETEEPPATELRAVLKRMNPAVPPSAQRFAFRITPTSGGCALAWIEPERVEEADRARADRFVRELVQHLERSVSTESHGTAKVSRTPGFRLPFEAAPTASAARAAESAK